MNLWTGIIIGVFVGANIGMLVAGLLAASKRSSDARIFQPGQYPMDEAIINDAAPAASLGHSLNRPHSDIVHPHA